MVFTIQKKRKYLNYRHFRIGDQMADDFFENSENIGYYDWFGLKRSDYRSVFRSDDGYSGRIIFLHTLMSISVSMLLFPHSHVNSIP